MIEANFNTWGRYAKALRCHTRWEIIGIIGESQKGTSELYESLNKKCSCSKKLKRISRQGLYYHLSELRDAEIIEIAGYIEKGGGAPEKIWKLKSKKIVLDLT